MRAFRAVCNRPSPRLLPVLLLLLVAAAPAPSRKPAEVFEGASHVLTWFRVVRLSGAAIRE